MIGVQFMIQQGLRVLVTGGASGIGWAIAVALQEQGARVHLCDASTERLAEALAQHPEMSGTVADVASEPQIDLVFDELRQSLGGLDVLVNNAGIAGPTAAVEEIVPDDWSRTLATSRSSLEPAGALWATPSMAKSTPSPAGSALMIVIVVVASSVIGPRVEAGRWGLRMTVGCTA